MKILLKNWALFRNRNLAKKFKFGQQIEIWSKNRWSKNIGQQIVSISMFSKKVEILVKNRIFWWLKFL